MMLPYDTTVFFAAMAGYNAAWWPVVLLGPLLAGLAVVLVWRGTAPRLVAIILAAFWLWVGAVHQLQLMATLNFMAPLYAVAWMTQAAAWLILAVGGGWRPGTAPALPRRVGCAWAAVALVGYPAAVWAAGAPWSAVPMVGTAPDPTALFTIGILLTATGRALPILWVVPVLWAIVAGSSAYLLRFPLDFVVPLAVIGAGLFLAVRRVA